MQKEIIARNRALSIGLDVDKKKSVIVVLDPSSGHVLFEGSLAHDEACWCSFLERFPGCRLRAFYEAGLTGFWQCRMLRRLGVDCQVVAPNAVPKEPERRQRKNDRLDAMTLALLAVHPPRGFVRVPTEQEEDDRELIRTREQLVKQRVRVINQVKAKFTFHGIPMTAGARSGSDAWVKEVGELLAERSSLGLAVTVLLDMVTALNRQMRRIEAAIRDLGRTDRFSARNARLQRIPGVGPMTAMAFLTEVFRPEEFTTSNRLASHLGLVPTEWSSGGTSRHGHLTRWGPPHLRRLLVEAAWIWVYRDPGAQRLYLNLCRGRLRKKAIVAMARRLVTAMWAMTVKQEEYNFHWKHAA